MGSVFVLYGAAVGAGGGDGDGFAGHGGIEGFVEVVVGGLDVGLIGGGLVVDGSLVDELAGGVDDEHVRGGLGLVEMADLTGRVEDGGGGCGLHGLEVVVFFGGGNVALLAGCGGEDGEPDDTFAGPLALEGFHVAAEVVLLLVGAALVGPLEDDVFAAVLGEGVGDTVGVDAFEVGGEGAGRDGEGGEGGKSKNDGEKTAVGHECLQRLPVDILPLGWGGVQG